MKKIGFLLLLIFLFAFVFSTTIASSATVPSYYDKYVDDFGKMFDQGQTDYLRNMLYALDQNTTAEVAVVTINECGLDYNGYAINLASTWKIGKADKDNGLLILYCLDMKKISVQTGYGLEGILPDSKIGRLLDDYYVPLRDSNKTKEGIIAVTEQLVQVIEDNRAEVLSGQAGPDQAQQQTDYWAIFAFVIFAYFIISRIMNAAYKGKKKKDLPWFFPIFIPVRSSGSSGGFSGGGFGGGGFGGGGFGGGGASR